MPKPNFTDTTEELSAIIRVNHAGEYGAVQIYKGQLKATNDKHKTEIKHMLTQEQEHFRYFDQQIILNKIRPTILMPFWHIGGYILGYISCALDIKYAMLVTQAVEEVIDQHYQQQINHLQSNKIFSNLTENIIYFQQQEREHHDTALTYHNSLTLSDKLLSYYVKKICKMAIYISKKL